ncbi:MAG: hypothetical protein K2J39_13720, partial [Ruminococcus sp.]|nr:hypothetical protein [Ruminococcus sp.]
VFREQENNLNEKIKRVVAVTGTVAVALASGFLLGKNFQKNQTPIEKVGNEISVAELTTEAPTTTATEIETTVATTHLFDYVVNEKSKKFHYPDCYSVSTMAEENKIYYTGSREELIEQNYEPCRKCCS